MSYNTDLQNNNTSLQEILATVNSLPEAGGSSGDGLEWIDVMSLPIISTGENSYGYPTTTYKLEFDTALTVYGVCVVAKDNTNQMYNAICNFAYPAASQKEYLATIRYTYGSSPYFSIILTTENDMDTHIIECKVLLLVGD